MRRSAACLALALASCVAPRTGPPAPAPSPPSPGAMPINPTMPVASDFVLSGPLEQGGLVIGTAPANIVSLMLDGEMVPISADHRFLIGFGRDAVTRSTLVGTTVDGHALRRVLAIAVRHWDVQSLPTLAKGTPSTPEQIVRRKLELAQIVAARQVHPQTDGWRQPFIWPVTGRISTLFGSQRIYAGEPGEPHSGIDIARPTGTIVIAPAAGVVVLAASAPFSLEGNLLMIDHGMGLTSAFLHLSRIDVALGDHVRQGQPLGAVGMTGRATGPHLHWGLVWQGRRVDPLLWAGPMPAG